LADDYYLQVAKQIELPKRLSYIKTLDLDIARPELNTWTSQRDKFFMKFKPAAAGKKVFNVFIKTFKAPTASSFRQPDCLIYTFVILRTL
jgi:hypothetical protein